MASSRFLVHHILPFTIASLSFLAALSYEPIRSAFIQFDKADTSFIPDTSRHYFANYDDGYKSELSIKNALHNGNAIVVMGSSEMTCTELPSIPYNFFNKNKIACIGFGHEGNQTLSILTQLTVLHKELGNSKLVIILSPGWFEDKFSKGTSLQSFLEFIPENYLYYLFYDPDVPQEIKDHIYQYVAGQFKNIDSPSSILKLIYYSRSENPFQKIAHRPFVKLNKTYCDYKIEFMNNLFIKGMAASPYSQTDYKKMPYTASTAFLTQTNWDSLCTDALEKFKRTSTNNSVGIENTYYDQWMRGHKPGTIRPFPENENQEFKDFLVLLKLLKYSNCKPLFVMQPLNPLVYRNCPDLDPILNRISEELQKNKFEYLNLHTSDQNKYIKGTLTDYQHMGDYAWYKIDKKINNYFKNTDTK